MLYYLTYILIVLYFSFPSLGDMSYNIHSNLRLNSEVIESIKDSNDKDTDQENKSSKKRVIKISDYSSYYNFLFSFNHIIFDSDFSSSQTEYFSFQTKLKETYLSKMLC